MKKYAENSNLDTWTILQPKKKIIDPQVFKHLKMSKSNFLSKIAWIKYV